MSRKIKHLVQNGEVLTIVGGFKIQSVEDGNKELERAFKKDPKKEFRKLLKMLK